MFGLWPRFFVFCCVFCCLLRCFRWRNASLAGGFAGRRFLFGCGFRFCCFNRFADSKDPLSLYSVFPVYSHVRTEPLARHRPHSRKKNYIEPVIRHDNSQEPRRTVRCKQRQRRAAPEEVRHKESGGKEELGQAVVDRRDHPCHAGTKTVIN